MIYLNEFDRCAAEWLRELSRNQLIPKANVDGRSIKEVQGKDLDGFRQCHFFAGIGGWSEALRLAGWPASVPCWTGSCPCQPFSAAGKGLGTDDPRHLWPEFRRLIAECRPPVVFGEQVASAAGRGWLDGVRSDLEGLGYAVGAADLCAAGVGAPHLRQRLYWVAHVNSAERRPDFDADGRRPRRTTATPGIGGETCGMDDTHGRNGGDRGLQRGGEHGQQSKNGRVGDWDRFDILHCADGKTRRVEAGTFPLAHGIPGRVGLLRGYGNAIVPPCAAVFVRAFMESF